MKFVMNSINEEKWKKEFPSFRMQKFCLIFSGKLPKNVNKRLNGLHYNIEYLNQIFFPYFGALFFVIKWEGNVVF